jgi:hypothetical protein
VGPDPSGRLPALRRGPGGRHAAPHEQPAIRPRRVRRHRALNSTRHPKIVLDIMVSANYSPGMKCICKQCGQTVTDVACREHPHAGIDLISPPRAAQPTARATSSRSRCPNPRDCGDPSCAGDCGY